MSRAFPIIVVADVQATASFYERAVGATQHHAHDDGSYAELRIGDLPLGLVASWFAEEHWPGLFAVVDPAPPKATTELYVEVADARESFRRAVAAGGIAIAEPVVKPWGLATLLQAPDGTVLELVSKL